MKPDPGWSKDLKLYSRSRASMDCTLPILSLWTPTTCFHRQPIGVYPVPSIADHHYETSQFQNVDLKWKATLRLSHIRVTQSINQSINQLIKVYLRANRCSFPDDLERFLKYCDSLVFWSETVSFLVCFILFYRHFWWKTPKTPSLIFYAPRPRRSSSDLWRSNRSSSINQHQAVFLQP